MKNSNRIPSSLSIPAEKKSEKLLMDKMGLSQKELRDVRLRYGVSASQLLEIMSLSKYQFIFSGRTPGQCEPCYHLNYGRRDNC
jgi:hypothetical protein